MNASTSTGLQDLVNRARQGYEPLEPITLDDSITPESFYLATPNRLAYALAWIVASEIVSARFRSSAIDVLPVFHPEHGWDRFLITRRTSGTVFQYQPANEFGMLLLDGKEALRLTSPGGKTRVAIGREMLDNPDALVQATLARVPRSALNTDDSNRLREHERAPKYPLFYRAVTELIVEYPGLTASREIYIDDEQIDGQFHPLYLHAAELTGMGPDDRHGVVIAKTTYNWFQLQYGELFAFFDRRGNRSVYRTERATWSRVSRQLDQEDSVEQVKQRLKRWLRLDGLAPDPVVD
jgi:hypothetical protein